MALTRRRVTLLWRIRYPWPRGKLARSILFAAFWPWRVWAMVRVFEDVMARWGWPRFKPK